LQVGRKFFLFMFFIVFLSNTVLGGLSTGSAKSGSGGVNIPVVKAINTYFIDPVPGSQSRATFILNWIGDAVAKQGTFFITFILTQGLLANSTKFLKVRTLQSQALSLLRSSSAACLLLACMVPLACCWLLHMHVRVHARRACAASSSQRSTCAAVAKRLPDLHVPLPYLLHL
jgi:signal transduction histidine kinase